MVLVVEHCRRNRIPTTSVRAVVYLPPVVAHCRRNRNRSASGEAAVYSPLTYIPFFVDYLHIFDCPTFVEVASVRINNQINTNWVLEMGYVILLWHSLSLPYNYFSYKTYKFMFSMD